MREPLKQKKLKEFIQLFGKSLTSPARVYISGGGSAVQIGWRDSTVDIDLKIIPDKEAFSALAKLKETLKLNIELASPDDFIPAVPGWELRSVFIERVGVVDFFHFDFYTQALAKLERGFERDIADVRAMIERKLVEPNKLRDSFAEIESTLERYPALDKQTFKQAVESFLTASD